MKPMKNYAVNLKCLTMLSILSIVFTNCSKKDHSEYKPKGKLSVSVGILVSSSDVYSELKAASVGDFKVIIYNSEDVVVISFDKASEMPAEIELPDGNYYVVANSVENPPAAFEKPYYYGISNEIAVTAGHSSTINVTCSISNILVSIVYSDNVKKDFSNYSTSVSNSGGSLVFLKDELRTGFFNGGPLYIEASLSYNSVSGSPQIKTLSGTISNPEPRKHYEVHIDASLSNGSFLINLVADETVTTEVVQITDQANPGEPSYGDLLITEIMYDPSALSDAAGEWIEIYNASASTINMKGLVIRKASGSGHRIAADVVLLSHNYAVLARSDTATPTPNYVYSSISLTNTADQIIISKYGTNGTDGTVICSVSYSTAFGFPIGTAGSSIQLDLSSYNVESAKLGTNWCTSTLAYSTGDKGTPGGVNAECQ
jgi:hypothetical protein